MMATVGNALVSKIRGHTPSEKAFRPSWDNLEDFLVYSLVMLGLVVAPTAIINGTPLDCNFCQEGLCSTESGKTHRNLDWLLETISNESSVAPTKSEDGSPFKTEDPQFNAWWVKKFCTMTAIDEFLLYFPYILLIMPLMIVLIERVFIRMFRADLKLNTFYNLLVDDNNDLNVVDTALDNTKIAHLSSRPDLSRVEIDLEKMTCADLLSKFATRLENSTLAMEVAHSFAQSSNFYKSYLIRTLSETSVAVLLLVYLLVRGVPSIQKEEFIYCDVHGYLYECAGHPQQFYMYILCIVILILTIYLCCCIYSLLWLTITRLGSLSRLMNSYKKRLFKIVEESRQLLPVEGEGDVTNDNVTANDSGKVLVKDGKRRQKNEKRCCYKSDREILGDLLSVYYENRDLKLLLDLLAESSGIASSLRMLALFDADFRSNMKVSKVETKRETSSQNYFNVLSIKFRDAPNMRHVFSNIRKAVQTLECIYTVELLPHVKQTKSSRSTAIFKYCSVSGDRKAKDCCTVEDGDESAESADEVDRSDFIHDTIDGIVEELKLRKKYLASSFTLAKQSREGTYTTVFQGLNRGQDYILRFSTILNGKVMARRFEPVPHLTLTNIEEAQQ